MKSYITLLLILVASAPSYSQEKISLGIQGGIAALDAKTTNIPNRLSGLEAKGGKNIDFLVYGKYTFAPNWAAKIGLGAIGFNPTSRMENNNLNNSIFLDSPDADFSNLNLQLALAVQRDIPFGASNWGGLVSLGFGTIISNYKGSNRWELKSEEGIRFGYTKMAPGGEVSELLTHQVQYRVNDSKMIYHLRPEIGIYRQFDKHRLSASLLYAVALNQPLLEVNYLSISYFKEYYAAQYEFSGSFASLKLGYEYSF